MVFFICNDCGESIKKPSVEKHYSTKCRNREKNVTCMDCQKDFHGEDYVAHTKCITEAEKYSGKDYVPKENSGQRKQDTWIDIVRSILASADYQLSAQTREIFQRLETYENVPRKKAKFENFIANCLRIPLKKAKPVWEILEKELEKMKQAKQQELAAPKAAKVNLAEAKNPFRSETLAEKDSNANGDVLLSVDKNKKPDMDGESSFNNAISSTENVNDAQQPTIKNKKGKRKPDINGENSLNFIPQNEKNAHVNQEPVTKKKKKEQELIPQPANQNPEAANAEIAADKAHFEWSTILEKIVAKHPSDGITLEKLKLKLLKKYKTKFLIEDMSQKQQKKFDKKFYKYLEKCPAVQVDQNVAKPCLA